MKHTRETITNDTLFALRSRARDAEHAARSLVHDIDVWLRHRDGAALDRVLAKLNGTDPTDYRQALADGRTVMPAVMPRDEFDGLIARLRQLEWELDLARRRVSAARARGVEPVTAETLTNERAMALGLHATRMRKHEVADLVRTWLEQRDDGSRDRLLALLNEGQP